MMFSNFIYFIIVLLIYSTYPAPEETAFSPFETLIVFFGLIIVFTVFTRIQFKLLEKRISRESFIRLDHQFTTAITRQSVMAIALFAVDIYALNLTSFFVNIPPFTIIPTLQAIVFLALFVFYLSIIWACAHKT